MFHFSIVEENHNLVILYLAVLLTIMFCNFFSVLFFANQIQVVGKSSTLHVHCQFLRCLNKCKCKCKKCIAWNKKVTNMCTKLTACNISLDFFTGKMTILWLVYTLNSIPLRGKWADHNLICQILNWLTCWIGWSFIDFVSQIIPSIAHLNLWI